MSNIKTRLEKLEQASTPADVPARVKVLVETFGGTPEDYMRRDRVITLEELVAGSYEPETAGGNREQ